MTTPADETRTKTVLGVIAEHTGYSLEELGEDAVLEDELGIDSLMREWVLADLETRFQLPKSLDREAATVGDIVAGVSALVATMDGIPPATMPDLPAAEGHAVGAASGVCAASGDGETTSDGDTTKPGETMKDFGPDGDADLFAKAARFADHRRRRETDQLYWYGMPSSGRLTGRGVYHDMQVGRSAEYLVFASNNYLGLANDPRVADAIADAARSFGATNTGSRIIGGTTELHLELERRLAEFKGRDACIVFPGGYSANLGTISALAGPADHVLSDSLNHMSLVDGAQLAGARRLSFAHNNMQALEQRLQQVAERPGGTLVAVDGVFSMHGDVCPLPELVELTRRYGARLLVDDAHSTGVLGSTGSGTAEHFGMKGEVDLEVGTMSKALAGVGGFVVGEAEVINYLRYYAHSYVFAATTPAPMVAGLIASLEILQKEPALLEGLWRNIRRLRDRLRADGFDLENSESAILPVVVGDEDVALRFGREVRARGMFCQTVVYPGVPIGQARLRISVGVEHTDADLDAAADIVRDSADAIGFDRSGVAA
ncbi:glycine C-acetyltransferase [Prauserella isguenensis]|uniref:8-amino-7-oxononanoate synthase n=1 Tax=Prauserella isguenensis TaxID=1470180 RepID=A0A839RY79_9PSEU|nr:aminotransferase class I/II-fold pyridoxal phosphate-dependent enzyme [Prauserella isguenensis]MBB3050416.1 glycine C-acetyltransferase [Prauserella isguenensis]